MGVDVWLESRPLTGLRKIAMVHARCHQSKPFWRCCYRYVRKWACFYPGMRECNWLTAGLSYRSATCWCVEELGAWIERHVARRHPDASSFEHGRPSQYAVTDDCRLKGAPSVQN